jgi:hypothetical protein
MNEEHVYCTDCKNFILDCDFKCDNCLCKGCDCLDFEDSRPFKNRPKYIKQITIKPKIKDGKILLNKSNKDHRYIMEDE